MWNNMIIIQLYMTQPVVHTNDDGKPPDNNLKYLGTVVCPVSNNDGKERQVHFEGHLQGRYSFVH